MKKNKKIIFGLGTGRCGTMSLSKLLSHQKNSIISHELGGLPWLSWKKDKNFKFSATRKKILAIAAGYNNNSLASSRNAKTMVLST